EASSPQSQTTAATAEPRGPSAPDDECRCSSGPTAHHQSTNDPATRRAAQECAQPQDQSPFQPPLPEVEQPVISLSVFAPTIRHRIRPRLMSQNRRHSRIDLLVLLRLIK